MRVKLQKGETPIRLLEQSDLSLHFLLRHIYQKTLGHNNVLLDFHFSLFMNVVRSSMFCLFWKMQMLFPFLDVNSVDLVNRFHRTVPLGLIFLILGLQIFFQNIKVGGGKKIKIKITKKIVFI